MYCSLSISANYFLPLKQELCLNKGQDLMTRVVDRSDYVKVHSVFRSSAQSLCIRDNDS